MAATVTAADFAITVATAAPQPFKIDALARCSGTGPIELTPGGLTQPNGNNDSAVITGTGPSGYIDYTRGTTPVGDYNPDWAISFKEGSVKHIYFVAETKGSMSSMKLREIENTKIACARRFFDEIGQRVTKDRVKYDVVTSYEKLMDIVGAVIA